MSRDSTAGSSSRTIQVTIHRCTNISGDLVAGCVETTRGYFVKASIGNIAHRTADRQVDEETRTITWNEEFTFDNTTSSSLLLRVYRRRTVRTSKLIEKITVGIHEDTSTPPSVLPRAVTFEAGPRIEFSFKVSKLYPSGANSRQSESLSVVDGGVKGVVDQRVPMPTQHEAMTTEEGIGENETKAEEEGKKARQALESQGTPTPRFKRVIEGIEGFRSTVDAIAEVHPFAQIACAIFRVISDPFIEQLHRDEQVRSLLDSFANFCDAVIKYKGSELGKNKALRDVLKRAAIQLTEVAYFVQEYCRDGSFLKRAVKNKISGMDKMIEEYRTKLDDLKEEFGLKLSIETAVIAMRTEVKVVLILNKVDEIVQLTYLEDLDYVRGAGLSIDKMCLSGTRTAILDDIIRWASFDGSRVLLLCGGAGTGKSSIAHTIALRFKELCRLGSMFCFSRTKQATRTPEMLFPHIARDLADLHPSIRAELCKAIENKADRTASSVTTQFEKLVLSPAEAIRAHLHGPIVIVIDALDEAGTIEERKTLLDVLTSRLGELPPNFRVLITSRPARDIEQKFGKGADIRIKRMEDIPSDTTSQDIAKFVESQFAEDSGVGLQIQQDLVAKAQNLFQWAFVACRFILNREPGEPALIRCMSINPPPNPSFPSPALNTTDVSEDARLNQLYRAVLLEALLAKRRVPLHIFKFVMAWVLAAFEPLSCKSLNRLIAASASAPPGCEVEKVVASLGLLLSGVDDHDSPIAPLHISFRDFLTDFDRSGEFFVDLGDLTVHADVSWASLSIMKEELRFNICRLPTSHLANKDIPDLDKLIKKHIPDHLVYACRYWTSHFCLVPPTMREWRFLIAEVGELVKTRVLYWLEVLSVLGASESGLRELRRLYSIMKMEKSMKADILALAQDFESFWSYFAKCISKSAPHIYVSALPFTPKESLVAKNYTSPNDKALSIPVGQLGKYPACLSILKGHADSVGALAFSPDGTRIVSGSHDNTVRIWNAENGELVLGPLNGHTSWIRSVAFSPDGTRIISGADDRTIRVWNAENGAMLLGPLNGHTGAVNSATPSPDGSFIVSGSDDSTIRLWNSEDGQVMLAPLRGHGDSVFSVALSPDGTRIVSGSLDKTVRIWNTENGQMVLGPLYGHTDWVYSVSFSPDGTRVISGSYDKTIRIWAAEDGQMLLNPLSGHTGLIYSVSFSPDGTRIISGSSDKTIRIWNSENGQMLLSPLEGHTDQVYAVVFSPDGTRIISGSRDYNIRIWNPENVETPPNRLNGHTLPIVSVAFSPDGARMASGSDDRTIRVWNANNGEMILGPLNGHTNAVYSITFSPDGTRIVSSSMDHTIRIWSAESGQMLLGPLYGHTDTIWSSALSPDGSRIVSGSGDKSIRIWSAENGQMLLDPLYGHSYAVASVAFSPDGNRIISGSSDATMLIWDANNGQMLLGPLVGHTDGVNSASFSPDGSRIVSGSYDKTIRLWNADNGELLLGPLNGHTDQIWSVAFSPDGARIVSSSKDKTIRIWNAATGDMILGPLGGHTNFIRPVAFSPDGNRVISGSHDTAIRVWDVRTSALDPHATAITKELAALSSSNNSRWHYNLEDNWRIENDWVLNSNGDLLFYVPSVHHLGLYTPRTIFCIGPSATHLDLAQFVHGSHWEESFSHHGGH